MKKLATILTAAVLFIGTQSFTPVTTVTQAVQHSFSRHFGTVSAVSWERSGEYYFASFKINGCETTAAYSPQGDLIGTSRRIPMSALPVKVTTALNENYPGHAFSAEAMEIDYSGETHYYFSAQDDSKFLKLKATPEGTLTVMDKIRKVQ